MESRLSFHSQLSSIMEAVAKSALSQVCKLVDEDSAELRLELSRLQVANSVLAEKVNSLQGELTVGRSDAPELCKGSCSVGVQTVCSDWDGHVSGPPTIEAIFGKDWCINLWKDRGAYSLQGYTDCPQAPDEIVATLCDEITVTEIKEEDYAENAGSSCKQQTLCTEAEHEVSRAEEPERLSVGFSVDGSTCSLSFGQDGGQDLSAGGIEELSVQLVSINDTEEAFSTHIIPIEEEEGEEEEEEEEDDDDDDVQFIQESQQEATVNTAVGPSHDIEQQTLPADNTENGATVDKDSHYDFNMLHVETARGSDTDDGDPHTDDGDQHTDDTDPHTDDGDPHTDDTDPHADDGDPHADKFTCQICTRTFFHKGTLTRHMKSHKSNFCNICKQHFSRRNKLNSHRCVPPVPSQTVSKSCELCGKTFANPSSLRIHYVVHTGEKPHRCGLCGKGFTQKGNLKCHLRIHTGERPFCCVKCGKTFTQKVNLNHHLMAHINREVVRERPIAGRHRKNLKAETC